MTGCVAHDPPHLLGVSWSGDGNREAGEARGKIVDDDVEPGTRPTEVLVPVVVVTDHRAFSMLTARWAEAAAGRHRTASRHHRRIPPDHGRDGIEEVLGDGFDDNSRELVGAPGGIGAVFDPLHRAAESGNGMPRERRFTGDAINDYTGRSAEPAHWAARSKNGMTASTWSG